MQEVITIDNNDDEKVQIELEVEENDYKSNNINTTSDKINTEQAKEKVNHHFYNYTYRTIFLLNYNAWFGFGKY